MLLREIVAKRSCDTETTERPPSTRILPASSRSLARRRSVGVAGVDQSGALSTVADVVSSAVRWWVLLSDSARP